MATRGGAGPPGAGRGLAPGSGSQQRPPCTCGLEFSTVNLPEAAGVWTGSGNSEPEGTQFRGQRGQRDKLRHREPARSP